MAQTWTDDVFDVGHAYNTDLGNMENNFAALKSLFSGAAQPGSMAACHPWFDTAKHVLKVRNDGDSAWLGLMHGDVNHKLWVYRNAALSGWAVDSGVTDRVLSLKGGDTYTTGAATAGSWIIPDHTLTVAQVPALSINVASGLDNSGSRVARSGTNTPGTQLTATGSGGAHNHGATYRPAAAVGTLQYLDL